MKKLERSHLKRLKEESYVLSQEEENSVVGGVTTEEIEAWLQQGRGYTDAYGNFYWHENNGSYAYPFTQDQFDNWQGAWYGGFVYGWGYVGPEVTIGKNTSEYWKISDGYLSQEENGIRIYQNNGNVIFLEGVKFSDSMVRSGTGYQWNGTIHIAEPADWSTMSIMHEYGHYLQQKNMGDFSYVVNVGIPSMTSLLIDPENHDNQSFEQDATSKGNEYYQTNVY